MADSVLDHIQMLMKQRREAREHLHETVRIAREHGRTWAEIALVLGTSRQAAQQRFRQSRG